MMQETKRMVNEFQPHMINCKRNIISDLPRIRERWKEHFETLFLSNNKTMQNDDFNLEQVQMPSYEEVKAVIQKMKNNKASGNDEFIKHARTELWRKIHELITHIWEQEKMPIEWNLGIIVPLYKKGDKQDGMQ